MLDISAGKLYLATTVRSFLRQAHLSKFAHRIRMVWHKSDYEDKFSAAMLAEIRSFDCVWDVGANIGFYTEKFSERAQQVIAFEPIQENINRIIERRLPNVRCAQMALGEMPGEFPIYNEGTVGQFSSLAVQPHPTSEKRLVHVERGDEAKYPIPTVIKIDVEGFELEVLHGMPNRLKHARAAFVEVHFRILDQKGQRHRPNEIVSYLREMGFGKISWPDASHIVALKNPVRL
jgi:FkbM family methyltransferase